MQPSSQISCFCLFFLCVSTNIYSTLSACLTNQWYTLVNKDTGHYLDATSSYVNLAFFTGFDAELWRFECQGLPGGWNIISKRDQSLALDVDANGRLLATVKNPTRSTQVWTLNSDGTLWNNGARGYLGYSGDKEVIGEVLLVASRAATGNDAEAEKNPIKFSLREQ